MSRTRYITDLLQERMKAFVAKHEGTRNAAKILEVDPSYVSRLCKGGKREPNDKILKRLGLIRTVVYVEE